MSNLIFAIVVTVSLISGFMIGVGFVRDTREKRRAAAYKGLWLKTKSTLKQWKSVAWRGRRDG